MPNKTVADIYGKAEDLLRMEGAATGIPGLEEERTIEWIDDLHKQFFDEFTTAGRNFPLYMRLTDSITAVSGTTEYELPTDFGRCRVERNTRIPHDGLRSDLSGYTQVPELPRGGQFALTTTDVVLSESTAGDLTLIYDQAPTTLTADTSPIDIPDKYADHMYLVHGLKGIFKQILDDDYVPQKERAEQTRIVQTAMNRENVGKKVSASNAYFSRYGL